jgi:serine/threonine protein kinase
LREISILKKLDHPNIIKLLDVICTENHLYLVMEVAEGMPLFDYICENKNNYTEENAKRIIKSITETVYYLHKNGIAHRDLKPENIISKLK